MTQPSQQSHPQAIQLSGGNKDQIPTASERGQFIAWLARQGMNPARANQLIKADMTRQEISETLIKELQL